MGIVRRARGRKAQLGLYETITRQPLWRPDEVGHAEGVSGFAGSSFSHCDA